MQQSCQALPIVFVQNYKNKGRDMSRGFPEPVRLPEQSPVARALAAAGGYYANLANLLGVTRQRARYIAHSDSCELCELRALAQAAGMSLDAALAYFESKL